ncbi:hypothetical protein Bca52824_060908 [Brassica carinata]|uniref:Uncharacterized protein n=1 Tax=Brassica carinata TaxID=52824 RepID=A0A8X7QZG8_BRACI|nr:hypothetical protein Bca52824_060908 [Brassica carinata]
MIKGLLLVLFFLITVKTSASRPLAWSKGNMSPGQNTQGESGSGRGPNWDYNWGWGSAPGSGWGYGSGSGRSPTGWGRGSGYGYGSGSGSGSGYGYGSGGGGARGGGYGYGSGNGRSGGGGGGSDGEVAALGHGGSDSGRIVVVEYNKEKNVLDRVHQETFGKSGDVACLDIAPVPEGRQRSPFLAVGSYDIIITVRILSLDPDDRLQILMFERNHGSSEVHA